MTRLLVRSCRPKQQNRRASALRFRGVRPPYGSSLLCDELEDDVGLSGIVALMKMRESRLRCRVSMRDCGEALAEYGDGLAEYGVDFSEYVGFDESADDGVRAWLENLVRSGESIWRVARGEAGRPHGEIGDGPDMVVYFA